MPHHTRTQSPLYHSPIQVHHMLYQTILLFITTLCAAQAASNTIVDIALATPTLSTLVAALKAGDLVKTLEGPGPFTVFAPTDAAFAALPKGVLANLLKPANKDSLDNVLTYHVLGDKVMSAQILDNEMLRTLNSKYVTARVSGATIFINSAKVTMANISASNGVIHIIDAVLLPSNAPPSPGPSPSPTPGTQNIVQLAQATSSLSTLVTALKKADLVKTLEGTGPFTVFAPNNAAFTNLPDGVLANLLKNKPQLVDLLNFHVVAGNIYAKDILDGERIKTVEGKYIMATVNASGVFLNNAKVITADVNASNGVVHIIDAVLEEVPSSPTNHLWFRGWTGGVISGYRCGEVDAGPRMPNSLFDPENKKALDKYINITLDLFQIYIGYLRRGPLMELGRCGHGENNYTTPSSFVKGQDYEEVIWAPVPLMTDICKEKCNCDFIYKPNTGRKENNCPDVPDDPKAGKWCSLCGPKFNAPIDIYLFFCRYRDHGYQPQVCAGPGHVNEIASTLI